MKKKQVSVLFLLIFYIIAGLTAAAVLFFIGTGKKKQQAYSPSSIEAAEKEVIIEKEEEPVIEEVMEAVHYYKFITTNKITKLNVRSAPGLMSPVINSFSPSSSGYVIEMGDGWTKVKTDTVEGYCSNLYLDFIEISQEEHPYF